MFSDPEQAVPVVRELAELAGLPDTELTAEIAACGDPDGALAGLSRLLEVDPGEALQSLLVDPATRNTLVTLTAAGPFLSGMLRLPGGLDMVRRATDGTPFSWPDPAALADVSGFADLQRDLRRLKRHAYLYLAARDLTRRADLFDSTRGLSRLAEIVLEASIRFCREELSEKHGDCLRADGTPVPYMVMGMGKLGAEELNFGSDIDLIIFYGDDGVETCGRRPLSPPEFFTRLSRKVIQAVGELTGDGHVFRVDMRLRPEGGSGALAWSLAAATAYYETMGDTWERAAFIKARTVAGDLAAGEAFLTELSPFVFRRYLDFASIEGIRYVKGRIAARTRAREQVGTDVKLGVGGIREIEFFVQSLQLIHGGKNPALRSIRTVDALDATVKAGYVEADIAAELAAAYRFLRDVEHRVQLVADEQTHLLPSTPEHCRRLAVQMGEDAGPDNWERFRERYNRLTGRVHEITHDLFAGPVEAGETDGNGPFDQLTLALSHPEDGLNPTPLNLRDPDAGVAQLNSLARAVASPVQTEQGRTRWRHILPLFFADIAASANPDLALAGLTRLAEAIKGRSIYAAMLMENPHARHLLARLFGASSYLSRLLARHPALLDELLAPAALLNIPDRDALAVVLARDLALDQEVLDEEAWLDAIRRFKHREVVRIGLSELLTDMDARTLGQALARLAEVVIEASLNRAWEEMTARHGIPPGVDGAVGGCTVVAMGRLGGGEMGYGSDLDLIFIHNGAPGDATDGEKPIGVPEFYARLGRRIVSKLTVPTGEGTLYEVDMRLRPSGASGQLVTSLAAFASYQEEQAWTWEKQALTRARVVADTGGLAGPVTAALRAATYVPRDPVALAREVAAMRDKMEAHLTEKGVAEGGDSVDLKQDVGGIVDIEFIAQYLLLAHGHGHPEVIDTNPVGALEKLRDAGLIEAGDADLLMSAMALYREAEARLQRVEGTATRILARSGEPLPGDREELFDRVRNTRPKVREIYRRVLGISAP